MKKEWKKPEMQILDVKMTLLGSEGDYTDAAFPDNTPKKDLTFS